MTQFVNHSIAVDRTNQKKDLFFTVEYHNPENLIFQHVHIKEKVNRPYRNKRLEEINRSRNVIIVDTLNSFDIVEIVECGVVFSEMQ